MFKTSLHEDTKLYQLLSSANLTLALFLFLHSHSVRQASSPEENLKKIKQVNGFILEKIRKNIFRKQLLSFPNQKLKDIRKYANLHFH